MKDEPSELAAITRDVMKKRKWKYEPKIKVLPPTKPRLYNPERNPNERDKIASRSASRGGVPVRGGNRSAGPRGANPGLPRAGIIEIRLYDDHEKEPYQGCVRFYGYGPSDYIVYLRRAYSQGVAKRRGGTGKTVRRDWYIASVQGTHFDDAISG